MRAQEYGVGHWGPGDVTKAGLPESSLQLVQRNARRKDA
jgi:hypothetical protein